VSRQKILIIIYSLIITLVGCGAAFAQEAGMDNDPFHPQGKKPNVSIPAPSVPAGETNDWGRDPFNNPFAGKAPVQHQGQKSSKRYLTGIIYSQQARVAIIGGETLREGAMTGDRKLEKIGRRSVVLRNSAGGAEELYLEDFSAGKQ